MRCEFPRWMRRCTRLVTLQARRSKLPRQIPPRLMLGLLVAAPSTRRRSPAPTCPPSVGWRRWSGPSSTARKATRLPAIRERPNCSLQILRAVARAAHRTGAGESPPRVHGRIARRVTCSMSRARRTPCTSRSSGSNVSSSSFPRSLADIDMHFKPAAAPPGVSRA